MLIGETNVVPMRKNMLLSALMIVTLSFTSFLVKDVEVEGVKFPSAVNFNNETLIFNGGGVREKLDINLYAAALYLKSKQSNRSAILKNNNTVVLKMKVISSLITRELMDIATEESFDKSLGHRKSYYRKEINQFKSVFRDGFSVGDVYDITFVQGKGILMYKNGVGKVVISGKEGFKEGVFDIWIGENPIQEELRDGLLGK